MHPSRVACLALLIAIPALPAPAGAEDMPKHADFRITYTSTNPAPGKPVQISPTRTHTVGVSIMAAVNQTGGKLLHNMAGRCTASTTFDNDTKSFENQGYCDYVDAGGDHVYEK